MKRTNKAGAVIMGNFKDFVFLKVWYHLTVHGNKIVDSDAVDIICIVAQSGCHGFR